MSIIRIHQESFKTLKDFHNEPNFRKGSNNPGVYMWGFSLEDENYKIPSNSDKFFPYYVGRVLKDNGCMFDRTQVHLGSIIGGNISIFDIRNFLKDLTREKKLIGEVHADYQKISRKKKKNHEIGPKLPHQDYPHLLHFPEGIHRMLHFTKSSKIKKELNWMLSHFCITYFTLQKYNKKDVMDLEKYIGNIIGYKKLITKPYSKPNLKVEIIDGKNTISVESIQDFFKKSR